MISWVKLLPYIGGAAVIGLGWWHYQSLLADREALGRTQEQLMGCYSDLEQQALMAQENRKKADRYYDQMDVIDHELDAALQRLRTSAAAPVPMPKPAAAPDAPSCPARAEFYRTDGKLVDALLRYAGDCERVRQNALGWIEWGQ